MFYRELRRSCDGCDYDLVVGGDDVCCRVYIGSGVSIRDSLVVGDE